MNESFCTWDKDAADADPDAEERARRGEEILERLRQEAANDPENPHRCHQCGGKRLWCPCTKDTQRRAMFNETGIPARFHDITFEQAASSRDEAAVWHYGDVRDRYLAAVPEIEDGGLWDVNIQGVSLPIVSVAVSAHDAYTLSAWGADIAKKRGRRVRFYSFRDLVHLLSAQDFQRVDEREELIEDFHDAPLVIVDGVRTLDDPKPTFLANFDRMIARRLNARKPTVALCAGKPVLRCEGWNEFLSDRSTLKFGMTWGESKPRQAPACAPSLPAQAASDSGKVEEAILAYLRANPGRIEAKIYEGVGQDRATVKAALYTLVAAGKVKREDKVFRSGKSGEIFSVAQEGTPPPPVQRSARELAALIGKSHTTVNAMRREGKTDDEILAAAKP